MFCGLLKLCRRYVYSMRGHVSTLLLNTWHFGPVATCSPWRKYWAGLGFFFLVTVRTWHFPVLKSICQVFSQDSSLSRSFCRCWQSSLFLMVRYKMVSSAKRRTFELMLLLMSFMYARKSVGPRDPSPMSPGSI